MRSTQSSNPVFGEMQVEELSDLIAEQKAIASTFLKRYVIIACYLPKNIYSPNNLSLLIINDEQSLEEMKSSFMLN